ncbi:MAG: DUF4124 domain-containing protein [Candidatus Obscuribacterales bacterium]|nr:DUF4124 domain-containing protein [Steroidobacteraceae bacterium]
MLVAPLGEGVAQTIWKWKDKNGVTHYSDQPGPNAVRVDLQVQTYQPEVNASAEPPRRDSQPAATYTSLTITAPANDETIQGTGGQVSVQLQVDPGLQSGHVLQVSFDGKNISGEGSTSLSYTLPEVERGSHTIQASVVAANGSTLISSNAVTFHVRAPSINRPAR